MQNFLVQLLDNKIETKQTLAPILADSSFDSKRPELFVLLCLAINFLEFKQEFFRSKTSSSKLMDDSMASALAAESLRVRLACASQELEDLDFLSDVFGRMSSLENAQALLVLRTCLIELLDCVAKANVLEAFEFNLQALKSIEKLFQFEMPQDLTLYRCFDSLDNSMGLQYTEELQCDAQADSRQRLFWGSGVSVQSSFSNIFAAIRELGLTKNSTFVDLGCGFGRWGLILGLLREDMKFIGYEFVESRVHAANQAKLFMGLGAQTQFITQDLSKVDFVLPEADYYYMYDPFDLKTYDFLMTQILQVAKKQRVKVITKGHACEWFVENLPEVWSLRRVFDGGNLNIFEIQF